MNAERLLKLGCRLFQPYMTQTQVMPAKSFEMVKDDFTGVDKNDTSRQAEL